MRRLLNISLLGMLVCTLYLGAYCAWRGPAVSQGERGDVVELPDNKWLTQFYYPAIMLDRYMNAPTVIYITYWPLD